MNRVACGSMVVLMVVLWPDTKREGEQEDGIFCKMLKASLSSTMIEDGDGVSSTSRLFTAELFVTSEQFKKLVNTSRENKLEKYHDPLALVAHTSSSSRNTSSYYVTHPTYVVDYNDEYQQYDIQTNSEDPLTSAIRNNRHAYVQEEVIEGSNESGNVQRTLRNSSLGNTSTVQCYNCSGKGHYDEASVILTDEQNDFLFADASRMKEIEDLYANICLMARIQPTNHSSDVGPSYDSAFIRNSLQGMFMLGPKPLSVYDQQLKHGLGDNEDTLDDASKSQQKVKEKMNDPIAVANKQNCWTVNYQQINALYKDFVPQKELSAELKYFPSSFIPSAKNSKEIASISASMPSDSTLIIELDKIRIDYQQINALYKDFVPQKELSAELKYFPSSFIPSAKNSKEIASISASMPSDSTLIIELDKIRNADHAGCKDDCKSTSGGLQFLVTWMRTQLLDYGYKYNRILMYCYSKSSIAISCNLVQHSKTRYNDIQYHFIKEHVEKGTVELYFVGTEYQLADLFTKALPKEHFKYLVHRISIRCMTPTQLESLTRSSS
uniref:Ribonuclease H n=1 Tax=Tanacetum cinerariifolium TaxID=118510 RepID=A0A699HDG0_TANCI|nr:ribonuclease H [Tanacetum cinerariifolium]